MRIQETIKSDSELLEESVKDADKKIENIEDDYEQLRMLREVMETGNFMLLINEKRAMEVNDLPEIHRRIQYILQNNDLLASSGMTIDYDGRSTLRTLGRRLYLSMNSIFSFSISTIFASAAAGGILSVSWPLSALFAVGSAAFFAAGFTNAQMLKTFQKVSEILTISDLIADSKPIISSERRNVFQRIWDWFQKKTPKEIQEDARRRAQQNAENAQKDLEDSISKLPETVQYINAEGDVKEYPIYLFFGKNFTFPDEDRDDEDI